MMRHIIPISGKDSLATAIVQAKLEPNLHYEYIYNETRMELPETYRWLKLVENTMGITIHRAGKNLEAIIYDQGILPSPRTRYCTRLSKIYPMLDYIGKDNATLYIGIRADEDRVGAKEEKNTIVRYPLKEHKIGLQHVYALVEAANLMPPSFFWQRLYDAVVAAVQAKSLIEELPRWIFDRTFAWRSRPNCFMCFYQRRYEWVGLLEHHPKLFERSEAIESTVGNGDGIRRDGGFFFIGEDYPLSKIRANSKLIFNKRVAAIAKWLLNHSQSELFTDALIDDMEMAQKSCGLYCGK